MGEFPSQFQPQFLNCKLGAKFRYPIRHTTDYDSLLKMQVHWPEDKGHCHWEGRETSLWGQVKTSEPLLGKNLG